MALILVNSTLGIYWCTDCGEEVKSLDHYCEVEEEDADS